MDKRLLDLDDQFPARPGDREISIVSKFLGKKEVTFEGEHARVAADAAAIAQQSKHNSFFTYLKDWARHTRDQRAFEQAIDHFRANYFERVFERARFGVEANDAGVLFVRSSQDIPVITETTLADFQQQLGKPNEISPGPSYAAEMIAVMLAAYALETRGIGRTPTIAEPIATDYLIGMMRLQLYSILSEKPPQLMEGLARADAKIGDIDAILRDREQNLHFLTQTIDALQIRNSENMRFGDAFVQKVADIESQQVNFNKALEERLKLNEARKLWGDIGWWSAFSFYVSGGILAIALAGIPVSAFAYRADIIEFIRTLETAMVAGAAGDSAVAATVSALGRLVLITAPLGLVVWLIRLLVRYNTRSMLLMDDARQRVTMLNTYLFLIEQDAAVKQDRGAILEALFRRPPGHGGDTAEPPHFTDLLKYGQEPAKP